MTEKLCGRCRTRPRRDNHSYCAECRREVTAYYQTDEYKREREARRLARLNVATKTCTVCNAEKSLTAFYKANGAALSRCKPCHKQMIADAFSADPDRVRAVKRRSRFRQTLTTYGLTEVDWDRLVLAAEGRCDICQKQCASLQIDHCHATGKVRGLLCGPCNKALGLLGDDPATLLAAITYLESSRATLTG